MLLKYAVPSTYNSFKSAESVTSRYVIFAELAVIIPVRLILVVLRVVEFKVVIVAATPVREIIFPLAPVIFPLNVFA